MRVRRALGVVLFAAMVAAAVTTFLILDHQVAGPETPVPLRPSGSDSGSLAAVQRAQPSVVRVERGAAPTAAGSPPGSQSAAISPSSSGAFATGPNSGGTGVVIDARGYILTAEAVVAGAGTIQAAIPGGRTVPATVVGSDPQDALTLLKVESEGLHPLSTTGTPQLVNGSAVVVLAAPPYSQVAVGAVTGLHASVSIADPSEPSARRPLNDLIALDVTATEGQLGAPVLDGAGRLAGIVVAGGTHAFSVDMAMAQPLVQQLLDTGHVSYQSLGFEYQQLSPAEASVRGLRAGVLVFSAGQTAIGAGLNDGDVVLSANGTTLDPANSLSRMLRGMTVRQSVALLVSGTAGQHTVTLDVQLVSP